jgi:hypothetical protein
MRSAIEKVLRYPEKLVGRGVDWLAVTRRMRKLIFAGYIPEAQSIQIPSSQDDIHTFLECALPVIT